MSVSFPNLGNNLAIISSENYSVPFSFFWNLHNVIIGPHDVALQFPYLNVCAVIFPFAEFVNPFYALFSLTLQYSIVYFSSVLYSSVLWLLCSIFLYFLWFLCSHIVHAVFSLSWWTSFSILFWILYWVIHLYPFDYGHFMIYYLIKVSHSFVWNLFCCFCISLNCLLFM